MNNDNLLQLEGAIESVVFRNDENGYTVIELADGDDYLTLSELCRRCRRVML